MEKGAWIWVCVAVLYLRVPVLGVVGEVSEKYILGGAATCVGL